VILDPTKNFLLAPDLSGDLIHVFAIGSEGMLERIPNQQDLSVPKGHGPRHGLFWKPSTNSSTTYLYMAFETANMVHGYSVTYNTDQTLNFTLLQDFPLPVPKGATAAEIKLTVSTDCLYS
jgi:6-phosphogluconolactonase (cycloisomerase 2 family)